MKRALVAFASLSVGASAIACSALLGLQDRTLRDGGLDVAVDAASDDAAPDAAPCDAGFCACHPHDFCDDFDEYTKVDDLSKHWTNTLGYPSPLQLGGTLSFDSLTTAAPSLPYALLANTSIDTGSSLKLSVATAFAEVDSAQLGKANVIGVIISAEIRLDQLDPADGSTPLDDAGDRMAVSTLALISSNGPGGQNSGVGITLSEQGGYLGYALGVSTTGTSTLAQGRLFESKFVYKQFLPIRVVVGKRSSSAIGAATVCEKGPVFSLSDAGPDYDGGADPLVLAVFPPAGTPTCEILSGALLDPAWLLAPILAVGSVQTGAGSYEVAFDNVTLDFLTQ